MTTATLPQRVLAFFLPALLITGQLQAIGCATDPERELIEVESVSASTSLADREADDWNAVADSVAFWGTLPFWQGTPRTISSSAALIDGIGECNLVVPLVRSPAGDEFFLCFRTEVDALGYNIPCVPQPLPTTLVWHTNVELRIKGRSRALYNLHSAVWPNEIGQICYMAYDSIGDGAPACKLASTCLSGVSFEDVAEIVAEKTRELYEGIKRGFEGAGMQPQAAAVAAYAATAIIFIILIAIPGPQPI